ncbi:MAG: FAD-binding oxidoreductase, partial [Candidatus Binatia bacterium]
IPARKDDERTWRASLDVKESVIAHVLSVGGSVSGEHGLGLGNRGYAEAEHGTALAIMKDVKRVFDPDGILNPGKIWP